MALDRGVLPIPDRPFKGKANRTLAGSVPDYPIPAQAPEGAPNVLLVLIDDAGFGNASTFGGPIQTATLDRLSQNGLKYNHFHVTALCSPSRAALISGRNHHAVGFGSIAEFCGGWPGYNATWPKSAASVAEILRNNGYNTAAFGKWHLTPDDQQGPAGPFRRWPNGLGFDYYWGFLGGEVSQYDTVIAENNTILGPPEEGEDFYFPDAMADKTIDWIRGQKSQDPEKPFFIYYATGASHAPHHVASTWADKYKGKFDGGWDALRVQTFERQKKLGVIPPEAELTPRNDAFPAWDSIPAAQKALFMRQMEVYAGYQENADWNVGRVVQAIDDIGILDNTLVIYILGDNGSSMEGTLTGCFNELTVLNGVPLTPEQQLGLINEAYGGISQWGGPATDPHFSAAWAWAGNTPFQWGKQVASHLGGTRDPMVVSWPARIKNKGGTRSQFTHLIDVVPTILEVANIPAPRQVNGIDQMPMHGVSFAYTFDDAQAPARHTQQYFEIFGNRAMYKDGWIASCRLDRIPWELDPKTLARFAPGVWDPDKDTWELYNLAEDFSQAHDLAQKFPDKLNELKALFWAEAEKYQVEPLLAGMSTFFGFLPTAGATKTKFTFHPGVQNIGPGMIPHVYSSSYAIEADLEIPPGGAEGAIVANADFLGGFSLYVQNGKLQHTYAFLGIRSDTLTSSQPLPAGPVTARFEFAADAPKPGTGGKTTLLVNGQTVAEGRLEHTVPARFSAYACMDIGRDNNKPVSHSYKSPFAFTGTIKKVTIDLEPTGPKTAAEHDENETTRHQTRVAVGING
jgi:arylsulfatase A-like enzyme